MTYIVCRYKPGGNVQELFLQNILPLADGGKIYMFINKCSVSLGKSSSDVDSSFRYISCQITADVGIKYFPIST